MNKTRMALRQAQVLMFLAGTGALIASAFGAGPDSGLMLYKTGIAVLLVDLVCVQLWSSGRRL